MLLAFSKSNDSPCFVKIAIFRHKSTLILIESEYFSFCQKTQYTQAFQRFKADPGSSRDRPFLLLCGFQKTLVKTGFVGILGRFVGFMDNTNFAMFAQPFV